MAKAPYRQYGKGEFTSEVSGLYHCGPDHVSPKRFHYEVEMLRKSEHLDDKGFLLDNQTFQEYFDNLQMVADSCEQLAKVAANHFHYDAAGGKAVATSVSIWGIPDQAMVQYTVKHTPIIQVWLCTCRVMQAAYEKTTDTWITIWETIGEELGL